MIRSIFNRSFVSASKRSFTSNKLKEVSVTRPTPTQVIPARNQSTTRLSQPEVARSSTDEILAAPIDSMGQETSKLILDKESVSFSKTYHRIVKDMLSADCLQLSEVNRWFEKVIQYNVPHGKRNRGLALVYSYQVLMEGNQVPEEHLELARVLGWCIEVLQAYLLVIDDFVDQSITRRGQLCWYRQDGVGLMSINDALLLESSIYQILQKHFSDKPYYTNIVNLFLDVNHKTIIGQCLDLLSTPPGKKVDFTCFTSDRYDAIIKYKTAFYSFVLPVRVALYMAGWNNEKAHKDAEEILLKMGHFFQVQDDFLDCFGDPEVIGKIGTDIEDGKCSWPVVVALQKCSAEQRKVLLENYGIHNTNAVAKVKQVYKELELEDEFARLERDSYEQICKMIDNLTNAAELPSKIFYAFLEKIYKRKK